MARIPVEKDRAGSPWWLWLLGLALVGLLAWFLIGLFDPADTERAVVEGEPLAADTAGVAVLTGEITDPEELRATPDTSALVGRTVSLDSLTVGEVLGDSTFFVLLDRQLSDAAGIEGEVESPGSPSETLTEAGIADRILVLMPEPETAAPSAPEGGIEVNSGDAVSIQGRVERFQGSVMQNVDLTEAQRAFVEQRGLFIRATRVDLGDGRTLTAPAAE